MSSTKSGDQFERMNEARERLMKVALDDEYADPYASACYALGLLDDLVGNHAVALDDELDFQDMLDENEDLKKLWAKGNGQT